MAAGAVVHSSGVRETEMIRVARISSSVMARNSSAEANWTSWATAHRGHATTARLAALYNWLIHYLLVGRRAENMLADEGEGSYGVNTLSVRAMEKEGPHGLSGVHTSPFGRSF